uniref:PAZ domain-containing protein n=2 Tax=Caenorhabditis tropicalis TaxID=1561998 RepID=A0A1I7TU99_9PELO
MKLSSIISIIFIIRQINSYRLDETVNEQRLNSCGKSIQSKIYMGKEVEQSKAPWAVQISLLTYACSGTIISSRHILYATHCVQPAMKNVTAEHTIGIKIWQMRGRKPMDQRIVRYRKNISANAVGTMLDFYGYGVNPPKRVHTDNVTWPKLTLRHETTQIYSVDYIEDYYFHAKDSKDKTIVCPLLVMIPMIEKTINLKYTLQLDTIVTSSVNRPEYVKYPQDSIYFFFLFGSLLYFTFIEKRK